MNIFPHDGAQQQQREKKMRFVMDGRIWAL